MHESGIVRALLRAALQAASEEGGRLAGVRVRMGVLAGGSPEHLREHLANEADALGLRGLALELEPCPDLPIGVELIGIRVARTVDHGDP